VAQALFTNAVKHNSTAAQIWWTKARMGWRGTTDVNVGGQQDNPVAIDYTWAPALPVSSQPPTINGEADHADAGGMVVSWESTK
jgi:hypothetical protein